MAMCMYISLELRGPFRSHPILVSLTRGRSTTLTILLCKIASGFGNFLCVSWSVVIRHDSRTYHRHVSGPRVNGLVSRLSSRMQVVQIHHHPIGVAAGSLDHASMRAWRTPVQLRSSSESTWRGRSRQCLTTGGCWRCWRCWGTFLVWP